MTNLPKLIDFNTPGTWEEQIAAENFLGKTLEEAYILYEKCPWFYAEDLFFMGISELGQEG